MDTTSNLGEVVLVKDINPGVSETSRPIEFFDPGGQVESNEDLNSSTDDGAETSTPIPASPSFPDGSYPGSFVQFKDQLYFNADDGENGRELFVSDGTADGTQLLVDLYPGEDNYGYTNSSFPYAFEEFGEKLYFSADNGESGREVFVSDGTPGGTQLLVDLYPGEGEYSTNSSRPTNFVEFNDKLYFTANDGTNGDELYVSDGTGSGTQLLVDLNPGENSYGTYSSYASNFVEFNDKLYFTADNGDSGQELFVSDGTAEGTQLVADINPGNDDEYGSNYGSFPGNLVEFNDQLYFTADNGENGTELYFSDGTAEGTQLLVDIYPGENDYGPNSSFPSELVEFNDKLYFTANDGENGLELFATDGTAEGTQLLVDIYPGENDYGPNSSAPSNLVEFNNNLYFAADNGENGYELFVSDGTTGGTQLVADIYPGENSYGYSYGSNPAELTVFGNELFFTARNAENGGELFKLNLGDSTDGTPVLMNESDDGSDNLLDAYGSEQMETAIANEDLDCLC